jgi:hypothetical protein
MFKNTTENVELYTKFPNVTVAQCTLAKVTAVNSALPTIRVTATDPLIIIGLDTVGGTDGWLVESDKHDIRGVRATGASLAGVHLSAGADQNKVTWNALTANGVGLQVEGNLNDLRGGTVEKNTGDGVQLIGNANILQGATVQSNGGVGINVSGASNKLKSDKPNTSGQGGAKENASAEYCFTDSTTQDLGSNKKDNANFVGQIAGSPRRYAAAATSKSATPRCRRTSAGTGGLRNHRGGPICRCGGRGGWRTDTFPTPTDRSHRLHEEAPNRVPKALTNTRSSCRT